MTKDIVQAITDAEAQAAKIKEAAVKEGQRKIALAESAAAEKEKTSSELCKAYRETRLKAAENDAQKEYEQSMAKSRAHAQNYAKEVLASADVTGEIVRRIVGGNR